MPPKQSRKGKAKVKDKSTDATPDSPSDFDDVPQGEPWVKVTCSGCKKNETLAPASNAASVCAPCKELEAIQRPFAFGNFQVVRAESRPAQGAKTKEEAEREAAEGSGSSSGAAGAGAGDRMEVD